MKLRGIIYNKLEKFNKTYTRFRIGTHKPDNNNIYHTDPKYCTEILTLNLLTTTIVAPPSNASKWQMGFNSAFKGKHEKPTNTLIIHSVY